MDSETLSGCSPFVQACAEGQISADFLLALTNARTSEEFLDLQHELYDSSYFSIIISELVYKLCFLWKATNFTDCTFVSTNELVLCNYAEWDAGQKYMFSTTRSTIISSFLS